MNQKSKSGADLTISYDAAECGTIRVRSRHAVKDQLKSLPCAKWEPHHKRWTYPANCSALRDILGLAVREGLTVELVPTTWALLKSWDEGDERRRTLLAKDDRGLDLVEKAEKGFIERKLARSRRGKSSWGRAVVQHSEDLDAIRKLLRELGCDRSGSAEGE